MFRLVLAALAAPLVVFASPMNLSKRTPGRATYYQTGLGACGQYNNPGDFIVALNSAQYGSGYPGPNCFRGINIHYNGKTAHAVVMDECPYGACNYGDLDLSQGLFEFFEPTSTGVFYMEWEFDGEGGAPPPPPPPPPPPVQEPPPPPPVDVPPPVYVPPPVDTPVTPPPTDNTVNTNSNVDTSNSPPSNPPADTPANNTPVQSSSQDAGSSSAPVPSSVPTQASSAPYVAPSSSSTLRPATNGSSNNGAGNVAVAPVDDTNGATSVTASVTLALGAFSALVALL